MLLVHTRSPRSSYWRMFLGAVVGMFAGTAVLVLIAVVSSLDVLFPVSSSNRTVTTTRPGFFKTLVLAAMELSKHRNIFHFSARKTEKSGEPVSPDVHSGNGSDGITNHHVGEHHRKRKARSDLDPVQHLDGSMPGYHHVLQNSPAKRQDNGTYESGSTSKLRGAEAAV